MSSFRRTVLALGLLIAAGMGALPPWLEMQIQLPPEEWHELFAAPSTTAAMYAPI